MRSTTAVAFATGAFLGLALGLPAGAAIAPASASPGTVITEDDPRWDCRTMGDQVCGPANVQGVPAGLYRSGDLASPWPTITTCSPGILGLMACTSRPVDPTFVRVTGWGK